MWYSHLSIGVRYDRMGIPETTTRSAASVIPVSVNTCTKALYMGVAYTVGPMIIRSTRAGMLNSNHILGWIVYQWNLMHYLRHPTH